MSTLKLSEQADKKVEELKKRYPNSSSAVMPTLYIAQQEVGWVSPDAINWVAEKLNIPRSHVKEVSSFYTMYYKKPVGKYHIQICRTLSCMICGAKGLTAYVKDRLKVKAMEVTADGMWSFEEVECLGSCGTAPMIQLNDVFFENLTPDKLGEIMNRVEKEKPDLRFSGINEALGNGMPDMPRSQVW